MSEKKVFSRNFIIFLVVGIVFIISLGGLISAFMRYSSIISEKDNIIQNKNTEINQLEDYLHQNITNYIAQIEEGSLPRFTSYKELTDFVSDTSQMYYGNGGDASDGDADSGGDGDGSDGTSNSDGGGIDYSPTNIQVLGVDEADIVKTDGKYIYLASSQGSVFIAEAFPTEKA